MATLEERIAALEQRLAAVPLAANPPVTIGELTDVPAPGSPIASQWAQEVSGRIIHRFGTVAAMNASNLGAGASARVGDVEYICVAVGSWARTTPAAYGVAGAGGTWTTAGVVLATISIPASPIVRIASFAYHCLISSVVTGGDLSVKLNGSAVLNYRASGYGQEQCTLSHQSQILAVNTAYTLTAAYNGGGSISTFGDPLFHQLNAAVHPA